MNAPIDNLKDEIARFKQMITFKENKGENLTSLKSQT